MLIRLIRFVVLLSVVYWATGAGQFVHEWTEHLDHGHRAAAVARSVGAHAANHPPAKANDDDDDACIICQMLAHMSAQQFTPPPAILVRPLLTAFAALSPQSFDSIHLSGALPIRGPPSLA